MLNKTRLLAALMALVMICALCGCGGKSNNAANAGNAAEQGGNAAANASGGVAEKDDGAGSGAEDLPAEESSVQQTVTVKAAADGTPRSAKVKTGNDDMLAAADIADLPFAVKVRYFLEDQEISPDKLAGATGNIKIRFEYENRSKGLAEGSEGQTDAKVPFAFISMVALPDNRFSNVKVEGGMVSRVSGNYIAMGYAMPGVEEQLGLEALKTKLRDAFSEISEKSGGDEDSSVQNYVEISAFAVNCRIDFTATVVTNGLLAELKDSRIDKIADAVSDLGKFSDTGSELKDGAAKLANGAYNFESGLGQYVDSVSELASGAKSLSDGAAQLDEGLKNLRAYLDMLEAQSGMDLAELKANVDALSAGASQLSGGAGQLNSGASALSSSGQDLKNGFASLRSGINSFRNAINELSDKLLSKIGSLSEGEAPQTIRQLRSMKQADEAYKCFTGDAPEDGSVVFILETDEIK